MATEPNEVLRKLREAAAKRDAIPDSERTAPLRPDRYIGEPIGVDDQGNLFPENQATPPATEVPKEKTDAD